MERLTSERPSIDALQSVERNIIQLLDIAHETMTELAKRESDSQSLSTHVQEYIELVKKIRDSVANQIQRINTEVPYLNTVYRLRKDAQINQMKVEYILEQLRRISSEMAIHRGTGTPMLPSESATPVVMNTFSGADVTLVNKTEEVATPSMQEGFEMFGMDNNEEFGEDVKKEGEKTERTTEDVGVGIPVNDDEQMEEDLFEDK
ncbi:hypothetical protein PROFUN_00573 [Planoprotostelium fungivorum]|uniref:Uncharacterized protein n=1 Tax=Planoprotostelium fungivorum TaxID=1890364 RepID=A0A2P6N163_9EUKA|nr:hypothetical protein PROFUN_00573 [Planoprotostelium fungivorum]